MKKMNKKPTFFSLFAGAGGFDIGFRAAGFESLGASDIMPEAEETFRLNWPNEPFIAEDIRKLTSKDILRATGGKKPDILIGGPPCQGFSVMGDKNSSDPRNTLFEPYARIIKELQPQCFVFENVKGFKTMFGGRYLQEVINLFSSAGYDVYFSVLNASDYGVPQNRERVVIIGTKLDHPFKYPKKVKKSVGKLKARKNVKQAIMDLVDRGEEVLNHIALNHGDIVVERYKLIPEGGKLPPPEQLPKKIRRKSFGNTYTRLHREKISPTMVPGNNAFPVHPTLNRSLTPREAARIQTFPDDVVFAGPRRSQCILVGNAVPPLMAAHIANSIKKHINREKITNPSKPVLSKFQRMANPLGVDVKKGKNNNRSRHNKSGLTFVDLFSGAGGITVGLMNAGLQPLLCADNDQWVEKTHRHNFPDIPYFDADISTKEAKKQILEIIGKKEVDLVVGGPPCQGFSIFGNRRFVNTQTRDYDPHKDPRNKLVYTFVDYIKTIKPKWFIMENVPGFASLDDGSFLNSLQKELKEAGYENDYKIINTAHYGVPQQRKRFILIGNRTGHIIPWPKQKFFEEPEDWQKAFRGIGEVISDLSTKKSQGSIPNHEPMNHSERVHKRFSYIKEGEKLDVDSLPKELKMGTHTKKPIKNYSHVYKRLHRNLPSITLVPGHSAFPVHPWLDRQLTVREAARIQTFPDNIEFQGPHTEQCRQVGNAFPPMAAETIGNMIAKAISNNWKNENLSELAKYSLVEVNQV